MQKHTHRQHETIVAYLDEQWNSPDLHCYYMMQIAQEVRRVLSTKPNDITIDQFKLPFARSTPDRKPEEVSQEHIENIKSVWIARVGGEVETRTVTKEELNGDHD